MVVICINNSSFINDKFTTFKVNLTMYKEYKVIDKGDDSTFIINDNDVIQGFLHERFISLKEFRKLKLKEIGK